MLVRNRTVQWICNAEILVSIALTIEHQSHTTSWLLTFGFIDIPNRTPSLTSPVYTKKGLICNAFVFWCFQAWKQETRDMKKDMNQIQAYVLVKGMSYIGKGWGHTHFQDASGWYKHDFMLGNLSLRPTDAPWASAYLTKQKYKIAPVMTNNYLNSQEWGWEGSLPLF